MKITEGYMPYLGYKTYYRIAGECSGNKNHSFCFTEDLVLHITTLKYLTGLLMKVVQLFPTTSSAAVILM